MSHVRTTVVNTVNSAWCSPTGVQYMQKIQAKWILLGQVDILQTSSMKTVVKHWST